MAQVGSAVANQLGGGVSFTLTKNVTTSGHTLLLQFSGGMGTSGEPTVTDSTLETWVKDKSSGIVGSFNTTASIWRLTNASVANHVVTVNGGAGGGSYMVGTLEEWAGLLTPTPTDVSATNSSSTNGTSGNSGTTATTAQATELAVAAIAVNPPVGVANDGLTTPSGWTNQQLYVQTNVAIGASHITKELSTTGTQQAAWTWTESSNYAAVIQTYKYAGGTATDVNCTVGAAVDAGLAATVQLTTAVNGTVGAAADAGLSAAVVIATNVAGTVGAASDVGQAATVQLATAVNATVGAVADAGLFALVQPGTSVNASVGASIAAGLAATIITTTTILCALGLASNDGQAATVQLATAVNCTTGAATGTGSSAAVQLVTAVNGTVGAASDVGQQCAVQVGSGVSIVSVTQIKQFWQSGTDWTAKNVSVTQAGDALIAFGAYYAAGTLGQKYPPTDNNGTFVQGVDTGRPDPGSYPGYPQPVTSNIYYEFNAAVGVHAITPPNIGPNSTDDGNVFVAVVRGLTTSAVVRATGHSHNVSNSAGTTFASVSVSLSTPCQIGDDLFAVLVYDDDRVFGTVTLDEPTSRGWSFIGHDTDANTSCPCGVYWKIATAADTQTVTLGWNDPHATVTDASIIAFAPLAVTTVDSTPGAATDAGLTANVQVGTNVNATVGTASDAGQSASVQMVTAINATVGTAIDAGPHATVQIGTTINATAGTATDAGLTAAITTATNVPGNVGTSDATGQTATVQLATAVNCGIGGTTDAGLTAAVIIATNVSCNTGGAIDAGLLANIGGTGATVLAAPSHIYRGQARTRIYDGLLE